MHFSLRHANNEKYYLFLSVIARCSMFLNYASLKVLVKKLTGAIKVEIVGELSLSGTATKMRLNMTESFSLI